MGAARCTEILLRKGALLKENGEDPPVVPQVIELALQKRYMPILDQVARMERTNPGTMAQQLQQQNADGMRTFLHTPELARSMVGLLLSMETTSGDFRSTPELEFLQSRLRTAQPEQDERREDIPTQSTIVSLMTQKNQGGDTVLQDKDNSLLYFLISPLGEKVNSNNIGVNFFTMW